MIDLDPRKVNQDFIRKQRRRSLFRIATVPIAVLIVLGVFCTRLLVADIFYISGNTDAVAFAASAQKMLNFVDPYIAYYNAGVADLNYKNYESAIENFQSSLANSPASDHLCKIYVNLALAYEYYGDSMLDNDDYSAAITNYERAEYTLSSEGCSSTESTSSSQQTKSDAKAISALERVREKRISFAIQINDDSVDELNYTPADVSNDSQRRNEIENFLDDTREAELKNPSSGNSQGLSNGSSMR